MRFFFLVCALVSITLIQAEELPGTTPLQGEGDFSAKMVAGIDGMALRMIAQSGPGRRPSRDKLKECLGLVDARVAFSSFTWLGSEESPAKLSESPSHEVWRVRWPVFKEVYAEGIRLLPKGEVTTRLLWLPDADMAPERALRADFFQPGLEVVIVALVSRDQAFSGSEAFQIQTNVNHREWIYRQAYELGRHVLGYEVSEALSVVDHWWSKKSACPILIGGEGEGGLIALCTAALDERVSATYCAGYWGPRNTLWKEPLERNVFGWLRDFGDAELASLLGSRPLALRWADYPRWEGPVPAKGGARSIAAPGVLEKPSREAFDAEVKRAREKNPAAQIWAGDAKAPFQQIWRRLLPSGVTDGWKNHTLEPAPEIAEDAGRQKRLVRQWERFTQDQLVTTERERDTYFWKPLPKQSLADYEKHIETQRTRFWEEVIGRLPDPNVPIQPRSRWLRDTEKVRLFEVTLQVWEDVFAWGILALPKDLKSGEKRPVVVCQHGLEGLPEDTLNTDEGARSYQAYKAFALKLAEAGFVTLAPHNLYRGKDAFRTLQRKLNPLGYTLYSVINGQHQRWLEWLKLQPYVMPQRIGFYGLSYGGKSAMRTPSLLQDYCLSICSGDFNEWVRKCVSVDMPMSYLFTGEHEIWEWKMGRTYNYAEMAALLAPRPFMVERGHRDGVGLDEWVNYEYAKVRRLYNQLGIGERCEIEHFDGPHTIHGVGTFEFLKKWLLRP